MEGEVKLNLLKNGNHEDTPMQIHPHPEYLTEEQIVLKLYDVGGFKFGDFTMRTGEVTPVYIDMRVLWSYPDLVLSVCELLWRKYQLIMRERGSRSDDHYICGIPYQGIPFATYMCTHYGTKMILLRKEKKTYGTCNRLEGHFKHGDSIVLLDDVLMTAGTIVSDVPLLEQEGLDVSFILVFLDREQGGVRRVKEVLKKDVYCVMGLNRALQILLSADKIDQITVDKIHMYLSANQFDTENYGVLNQL